MAAFCVSCPRHSPQNTGNGSACMAVNQSELKHLKLHDHEDAPFHRDLFAPDSAEEPAIAQTCASLVVRVYADILLEMHAFLPSGRACACTILQGWNLLLHLQLRMEPVVCRSGVMSQHVPVIPSLDALLPKHDQFQHLAEIPVRSLSAFLFCRVSAMGSATRYGPRQPFVHYCPCPAASYLRF